MSHDATIYELYENHENKARTNEMFKSLNGQIWHVSAYSEAQAALCANKPEWMTNGQRTGIVELWSPETKTWRQTDNSELAEPKYHAGQTIQPPAKTAQDRFYSQFPAMPTQYDGREYRSCHEARYAVFFDTIGLDFIYEHEWYQLPSGAYLPDFYLPTALGRPTYVEIKPTKASEAAINKCRDLCYLTHMLVLMLDGEFFTSSGSLFVFFELKNSRATKVDAAAEISARFPDATDIWINDEITAGVFVKPNFVPFGTNKPRNIEAIDKAKKYRFWNPNTLAS